MAAVMGHGGDGGDKPPHPFGGDIGVHQIDAVPPRRRCMVGSYMWRDIDLDKNTWKEVPEANRNGMFTYLSTYFDFQAISNDSDARILWESLNHRICQRYRGRKNRAKDKFIDMLEGAEAARAQPPHPPGMDSTRWSATIDHFLTDTHCKRSSLNKEYRKKQVVKNRIGMCSYGSASFKNKIMLMEGKVKGS
ncbi:unnamed protein product [Lactuca virosa]|uniref:Uncharacterized protein n=1 Tax=Lactuca virosa TaxID=75947 RepID=A0AAU9P1W9_9ASTR|nr:unnamed protein product [Lactuca virosa]